MHFTVRSLESNDICSIKIHRNLNRQFYSNYINIYGDRSSGLNAINVIHLPKQNDFDRTLNIGSFWPVRLDTLVWVLVENSVMSWATLGVAVPIHWDRCDANYLRKSYNICRNVFMHERPEREKDSAFGLLDFKYNF